MVPLARVIMARPARLAMYLAWTSMSPLWLWHSFKMAFLNA